MTRLLRLFLLSLPVALLPASVPAAEIGGLYEAVVPVSGQSPAERSHAVQDGFRQVLVKVSGQRSVLSLPAVQAELGKAETLLGSFRYETAPARMPGQAVDPQLAGTRIRLEFDPASVRAVLNRAGAPLWGASRPPVHLWIVRGEGGGGSLLAIGTPQADSLIDAATARGLPAVLPSPGDTQAPPGARVAVLATVAPAAGRSHVTGILRIDGADESLEASGVDEFSALRELVAIAADRLGAHFSVVAHAEQARVLHLRVTGVSGLQAYASLERWLTGLPLLKDVEFDGLAGDRASFTLVLAGDVAKLTQAMGADGRFSSVGAPVADGTQYTLDATLAASVTAP